MGKKEARKPEQDNNSREVNYVEWYKETYPKKQVVGEKKAKKAFYQKRASSMYEQETGFQPALSVPERPKNLKARGTLYSFPVPVDPIEEAPVEFDPDNDIEVEL